MVRLRTILLMWWLASIGAFELRVSQTPAPPAQDRLGRPG